MTERANYVGKIEKELDKPSGDRNKDKIAFWQAELDKIPVSSGGAAVRPTSGKLLPHLHSVWLEKLGVGSEYEQLAFYGATIGVIAGVISPLRKAFWLNKFIREKDPSIKKIYAGNASFTNVQLEAAEAYLLHLKRKPRKYLWISFGVFAMLGYRHLQIELSKGDV